MRDVRVFVSDADFKTYLDFFQANGTEAVFYTVSCWYCVSNSKHRKGHHGCDLLLLY